MRIHPWLVGLRWRWAISLAQGALAGLLLATAVGQQREHLEWLNRSFPERLPEVDLAYSPPAELIAVALNGPAVLPHFGIPRYSIGVPLESKFEGAIRVLAVCLFWFIAGVLMQSRSRKPGARIFAPRLSMAGIAIVAVTFGLLTLAVARRIVDDILVLKSLNLFDTYIRDYGWSAAIWAKLTLLVWFAGLSLFFGGAPLERRRANSGWEHRKANGNSEQRMGTPSSGWEHRTANGNTEQRMGTPNSEWEHRTANGNSEQ